MRTWQAHKSRVVAMAFSPDGRALVTASNGERNLAVWDALGGGRRRGIAPPPLGLIDEGPFATPTCLAFSADARYLAVGYGASVAVTEWRGGGAGWANRVPLPGGGSFAFAGSSDVAAPDLWFAAENHVGRLRGWDVAVPDLLVLTRGPNKRKSPKALRVAVSPDGNWVASNGKFGSVVWTTGGAATFARSYPKRSHSGPLAYAPDSETLALAHGNRVTLCDFVADRAVELVGHKYAVWGVGFSPGGDVAHTVSSDGTYRAFDRETGRQLRALDFGLGGLYAAAFSPDGLTGAAGSADGRVVVFDLEE